MLFIKEIPSKGIKNSNDNLKSGDLEIDLTNRLCFRQKEKSNLTTRS